MIDRRGRWGASLPRRLAAGLCTVALATQTACYTLQPMQEVVPVIGREVAVELSDRGRVLVGGQLGESVLQVVGRIVSSTDSAVTLSVTRTVLMQGSTVVWTGEQVAIPRSGVRGYRIRQFSRGRTVMLSVAVFAGLVLVGVGLTLVGGGDGRPPGTGGCEPNCLPF